NWQKRGWKTADNKPVENQDLWKLLLLTMKKHSVSYVKVPATLIIRKTIVAMRLLNRKYSCKSSEWRSRLGEKYKRRTVGPDVAYIYKSNSSESLHYSQKASFANSVDFWASGM
ncbi:MAG: hypothetical protein ACOX55_14185, partial [Christensenellales bacterium]